MLQETHSTPADEKIWRAEWGGPAVFCHGSSNSRGVSILFPRGSDLPITTTIRDPEGRFLILQVITDNLHVTLVNVYAPTSNEASKQNLLIETLYERLVDLEIQDLFIGGDFNVKMDEVHNTSSPARDAYINQINVLLNDYALVDVWKRKNPSSSRGTFHRNLYSARLDYLFAPEYLLPSITAVQILPEPLSDHCTVTMDVSINSTTRGPGYWRFDNRLLTDPAFVEKMKNHIRQITQEPLDDPNLTWEWT